MNRIGGSTHPWTSAPEEEFRRLARANASPSDIAQRLSRTPEQVFERARELGLTLKRAQPGQDPGWKRRPAGSRHTRAVRPCAGAYVDLQGRRPGLGPAAAREVAGRPFG